MICITGAGGTVGSELIRQVESANVEFRAAYFSKEKAEAARDNFGDIGGCSNTLRTPLGSGSASRGR